MSAVRNIHVLDKVYSFDFDRLGYKERADFILPWMLNLLSNYVRKHGAPVALQSIQFIVRPIKVK